MQVWCSAPKRGAVCRFAPGPRSVRRWQTQVPRSRGGGGEEKNGLPRRRDERNPRAGRGGGGSWVARVTEAGVFAARPGAGAGGECRDRPRARPPCWRALLGLMQRRVLPGGNAASAMASGGALEAATPGGARSWAQASRQIEQRGACWKAAPSTGQSAAPLNGARQGRRCLARIGRERALRPWRSVCCGKCFRQCAECIRKMISTEQGWRARPAPTHGRRAAQRSSGAGRRAPCALAADMSRAAALLGTQSARAEGGWGLQGPWAAQRTAWRRAIVA